MLNAPNKQRVGQSRLTISFSLFLRKSTITMAAAVAGSGARDTATTTSSSGSSASSSSQFHAGLEKAELLHELQHKLRDCRYGHHTTHASQQSPHPSLSCGANSELAPQKGENGRHLGLSWGEEYLVCNG